MRARKIVAAALVASLLFITGVGLLLLAGPSQAQEQETGPELPGGSGDEAAATVSARIPIQGRLTDEGGRPLTGTYQLRLRLYDASSGGNVMCEDTNWVSVEHGLFHTNLWGCSASDVDGKVLYLGVKVEDDPEMTPRRAIYPVPYAWSLRPGAVISDTLNSNAILHMENRGASGRGLRAYALSETGTNYGVVGASRSPNGYGGYFYNNAGSYGDGAGLYAESSNGVGLRVLSQNYTAGRFEGDYTGVYAKGGVGVDAYSDDGTAVSGLSETWQGVAGYTYSPDDNYGLSTLDNCRAKDYHTTGSMMQIVQNGGQEPLEPGDVAVFSGIAAPLGEEGSPVIQVAKATTVGSTAVAGVVQGWYNVAVVTGTPDQLVQGGLEVTREGPVAPGEYLLLVVQGPARVKASAVGGAIQPGDLLSSASRPGHAASSASLAVEGASAAQPGTILGKALEPLQNGDSLIYMYVTLD
jgi:hypothetical protein